MSTVTRTFGDYGGRYVPETLIPALDELCARYGDRDNRRVYMTSRDIEGRCLDLHHRATGIAKPID